jgi:hypothetical protein
MILETLRMVTDWLNDGTNGVNAMLATMPLDAADSALPTNLVTISDATRDGNVARKRLPATLPGIGVMALEQSHDATNISVGDDEGEIRIAIRLGFTNAQSEQAVRDSSYYVRAILKSFRRFTSNSDPLVRQRNSVYLEGAHDVKSAMLWEVVDDSIITGAVVVGFHTRDFLGP